MTQQDLRDSLVEALVQIPWILNSTDAGYIVDVILPLVDGEEADHIVRIDGRGFFNVKHPLHERVNDDLLDCSIHGVATSWLDGMSFAEHNALKNTVWRAKFEPTWLDDPEFAGDPFTWEKIK